MPIYEFECPVHGRFEEVLSIHDNIEMSMCPKGDEDFPYCYLDSPLVPSLCAMHPDKYWSGRIVNGEYVTSKSQVNPDIVPSTPERKEYIRKRLKENLKEKEEKASNNLINFLKEELRDVEITPDGNTVKERNRYVRTRNESATATTNS